MNKSKHQGCLRRKDKTCARALGTSTLLNVCVVVATYYVVLREL
jgi:hypothetical protein